MKLIDRRKSEVLQRTSWVCRMANEPSLKAQLLTRQKGKRRSTLWRKLEIATFVETSDGDGPV